MRCPSEIGSVFVFMSTLLVANGDIDDFEWLALLARSAEWVVGVDGGTNHLKRARVVPDLVVGDFDSISAELHAWITSNKVDTVPFPREKDQTDLELAIAVAARRSTAPIMIVGVFGGRIDQTIANVSLLASPMLRGRVASIVTKHEQLKMLGEGKHYIQAVVGDTLSFIAFLSDVHFTSTTGLKWNLVNSTLKLGTARGISNVVENSLIEIEISRGTVLCSIADGYWMR